MAVININDIKNQIAQETVMMYTGDLSGCGKILRLLDLLPDSPEKTAVADIINDIVITEFANKDEQLKALKDAVDKLTGATHTSVNIEKKDKTAKNERPVAGEPDEVSSEKSKPTEFSLSEEDAELIRDFLDESFDHIDSIEDNMLRWEAEPEDKDIINAIFRPFHTIKGTSGFLNLPDITQVAHNLENLLDDIRNDRLSYSQDIAEIIFKGVDLLRNMLKAVEKSLTENKSPVYDKPVIEKFMDEINRIKGSKKIGELLVEKENIKESDIEEALKEQKFSDKKIGELLVEKGVTDEKSIKNVLEIQKTEMGKTKKVAKFAKVDTEKLDNLMDMIGELVITQHMIVQNPTLSAADDRLLKDIAQMKRIVATLQDVGMSMRMVAVKSVFQKMKRLVRDLAKKSGKKIEVVFEGENTEMDRNMVDELYDPLVHIVRNSCDHGIETAKERKAMGKPETGLLKISAYHKGGDIVIEVTDDGRGLNKEKILAKAIERGLVKPDHNLTEKEIYNLIFMPGFSTAEKITDVSGRGVGMDVVRRSVERLRGKIEVKSETNLGTTISCILPLTLAIIDGMLIKIGNQKYILPTLSVKQSLRPKASQIHTVAGKGEVVSVMNKLLPLIRLKKLFGLDEGIDEPTEALIIVVENNGVESCLMVDDLIGKQEVVIKNLHKLLKSARNFAGCAILGDGTVGLILDISSITENLKNQQFDKIA